MRVLILNSGGDKVELRPGVVTDLGNGELIGKHVGRISCFL